MRFPKRRERIIGPIKPVYGRAIAYGNEATIFPLEKRGFLHLLFGKNLVHKVFRPGWITRNYAMSGSLEWISREALSLAMPIRDVQPPRRGRHGILKVPDGDWRKITFILSHHSADVIKTAARLGIAVPKTFRTVLVKLPGRAPSWAIEMTDLRKRGCALVPGQNLKDYNKKNPVRNYEELEQGMREDEERLEREGIARDFAHPEFGGWIVRINSKTHTGKRFLVDTTNFRIVQNKKVK